MDKTHFSLKLLHPKYWLLWFGFGLWWLLVQLLPFRVQMWLGALLGRLLAFVDARRRRITEKNIALCFPAMEEEERSTLLRRIAESTGQGFFDTGIAWFWPRWRLSRVLDVEGLEHLVAAREAGQGVLAFTYHFTTLEIGVAAVNLHHFQQSCGVYRPQPNPVVDYVMRKGRERHHPDLQAIPRKEVRTMVRALRNGALLTYLPDQDYGPKHSVFVPFFGINAATIKSPSQLCRMGRARVISYYAVRKPNARGYLIKIQAEPAGYGTGDEHEDACLANRFLESQIRLHPAHYLWGHRRFKSRPDGNRDFYGLEGLRATSRRKKRRSRRKAQQRKQQERR